MTIIEEPVNISEEIPEELKAEGVFENPEIQITRDDFKYCWNYTIVERFYYKA